MQDDDESTRQSRRLFLERAAKLAVYAPPVILMMAAPTVEAVGSGAPLQAPPHDHGRRPVDNSPHATHPDKGTGRRG